MARKAPPRSLVARKKKRAAPLVEIDEFMLRPTPAMQAAEAKIEKVLASMPHPELRACLRAAMGSVELGDVEPISVEIDGETIMLSPREQKSIASRLIVKSGHELVRSAMDLLLSRHRGG